MRLANPLEVYHIFDMSEQIMMQMPPRITSLDASSLAKLLAQWFKKPGMAEVVLVSFAFDPFFKLYSETISSWIKRLNETSRKLLL